MALQLTALESRVVDHGLVRAVLVVAVAIALMVFLTAVFGWHQLGSSYPYQIVTDPAGPAGLPF